MKIYRISSTKKPWEMTSDEFIQYHKTKDIHPVKSNNGWRFVNIDNYDILIDSRIFNNIEIEFRKSSHNDIIPCTKIVAFHDNRAIGMASEYDPCTSQEIISMDGVWVDKQYQQMGIGTFLLYLFRKQFDEHRKIGEMSPLGEKMSRKLHKKYIEMAIENNQSMPSNVYEEYLKDGNVT